MNYCYNYQYSIYARFFLKTKLMGHDATRQDVPYSLLQDLNHWSWVCDPPFQIIMEINSVENRAKVAIEINPSV